MLMMMWQLVVQCSQCRFRWTKLSHYVNRERTIFSWHKICFFCFSFLRVEIRSVDFDGLWFLLYKLWTFVFQISPECSLFWMCFVRFKSSNSLIDKKLARWLTIDSALGALTSMRFVNVYESHLSAYKLFSC